MKAGHPASRISKHGVARTMIEASRPGLDLGFLKRFGSSRINVKITE
jgi:hypothetical protein